MTDLALRTKMIGLIKTYVSSRINSRPLPDRYSSVNGQMGTFADRTVVGGHFALVRRLALSSHSRHPEINPSYLGLRFV